ncbi:uncharacterized protein C8A04DRAFT_29063 [Dichotomopilus funicola]|uniref:Uncharacterized protein n=1 Tax=Dichotomopilus funicola TaxID=1934379 RepID=A0AAN6V1T9_9PEZI|nr:hypothetical protein C8A04DRAFT_29063 [Dichotomopilus funicola]
MSNSRKASSGDIAEKTKAAFGLLISRLQQTVLPGQKATLPSPPQRDLYHCAMYLHNELSRANVSYYFCGGFACINVGMTARTTSDIDIAVPNGNQGYGALLGILSKPPFIQDVTGTLPRDSYYFFVESSGNFVEVDGIIAGFMAFPTIEQAKIIQAGHLMQLNFLEPAGLLRLKLSSWANQTRRVGPKRLGDISDIVSIRDLLASDGTSMDLRSLAGDTALGLREWVKEFKDLKQWQRLDGKYHG